MLYIVLLGCLGLAWKGVAAQEEPEILKHIQRGDHFAVQGRLELAVEEYEKALEAGAGSARFLNRLGEFYLRIGAFEKAKNTWQRSLIEKPGQISVLAKIGEAFMASGKLDSAIHYVQKARSFAPESAGLQAQLGVLYLQAGLPGKSRAHLDTALQLSPANPQAHRFLGYYFTQQDSLDLAVDHYHKVLEVLADDVEAYNNIAFLYALQARYRQSLDYYSRAKTLAQDPLINHAINLRMEAIRSIMDGKMRARYILVKTQAEARDLLQRLEQGEDFGKLAHQFSQAPNAQDGGDLGFFGPGELLEPFEQAVLQLQTGEVSDIVEMPMGIVIIQRLN